VRESKGDERNPKCVKRISEKLRDQKKLSRIAVR